MVFPSIPIYLDPSNWNQQQSQPQLGTNTGTATASENHAVQLPPVNLVPNITNPSSLNRVPNPEPGLKCPRCNSTNTKFCYFNNYSLSQPRHFCRTCRRYWTRGGTLRNVPVGGGSRRNSKRSKTSSTNATSAQNSSNLVSSTMHQIGISSLGTNLDAQNVGMGFSGMQMPMQFPFVRQLGQNTVPMQMGSINSYFNLNSRNDIGGTSNGTGGTVGASGKESNSSAWHIGLSGINPSSSGNFFQ